MRRLDSRIFQVAHGEVITLRVTDAGAQTNFGVNFNIYNQTGDVSANTPLPITMDKGRATQNSQVFQGAKVAELTLVCSFDCPEDGRYDVVLTSSAGGDSPHRETIEQFDPQLPESVFYVFHIT